MSSIQPLNVGSELLQYRLTERVGASVWRAVDAASGKTAALKILTRQLPKDTARREQLIHDLRLGAAIYHPFLVPILDVIATGDTVALQMEWVDGQPLSRHLGARPVSRGDFFAVAYQLADVVKLLQGRNMVHSNINGDSVMIAAGGQVKLGGLNGINLIARREGSSSPVYQQKGSDPRSVAYMAPEQITGQSVDMRGDVFSLGVVFYEMATGALPWSSSAAADIARAIVEGQPRSPRAINPDIDPEVMSLVGRCIFKDPHRRYKDAHVLVDDIARMSPESARMANELAARERTIVTPGAKSDSRGSILLLADLADYDELTASNPAAATKAAARLQQVVGEAAYLFDGHVVDPFGPRVVAEMLATEQALEAGRKAEFDFSTEQQEGEVLRVRLLLHAGDVRSEQGRVVGEGVTTGFAALAQLEPQRLYISEDFARRARGTVRLRDVGGRGGLKVYEIAPKEPKPEPASTEAELPAMDPEALIAPPPPMRSRGRRSIAFAGAGALLLVVGIGGIALSRHERAAAPVATAPAARSGPRAVALANFSVEGAEPVLLERARGIRMVSLDLLRTMPGVRVADGGPNAVTFAARVRGGVSGPEIVPMSGGQGAGAAYPLPDTASGVQVVMQWVAAQTHVRPRLPKPEALNAYAEALLAKSEGEDARVETELRKAVQADPTFLAAQTMAMQVFDDRGKPAEALAAAKQVMGLDAGNTSAARRAARGSLEEGDLAGAFGAYANVLRTSRGDVEALNTIGRYAASVGDEKHFAYAVRGLQSVPAGEQAVHQPDLLAAAGSIDASIDPYYDIETTVPNNPALALKIGRIAVLRRTMTVADLELGKLQQSDPAYGYRLLKAYIAAQKGSRAEAQSELKAAFTASRAGDEYWTSAAEIYAMLGDSRGVIEALQKAAQRREPTSTLVLNDRLFTYLASDAQFRKARQTFAAQQDEVRAALARIPM